MSLILLVVILLLVFGAGGGYYGYRRWARVEASGSSEWS